VTQVVVERVLEFFGDAGVERGVVQVFSPEPDDRAWRCAYRIAWPGYERTSRVLGEDAWQALQLAMKIVPSMISSTDDFKNGRVGLWGGPFKSYEEICEMFGVKPIEGPKQ
jgi:hypothetical protein